MAPLPDSGPAADHDALWLYGLPGSGVLVQQAAGAPSLAELEQGRLVPAGAEARIWICYGTLTEGLAELVHRHQQPPPPAQLEAELEHWQADLSRAAVLKRRWRDRVHLVNLCESGSAPLARDLPPELLGGRRQSGATVEGELAMRALLEGRPGLLNAWLDAEHWADRFDGEAGEGLPNSPHQTSPHQPDWRRPMPTERLVLALWPSDSLEGVGRLELERRCLELEHQMARLRDHIAMLRRYCLQMERELDHFMAKQERAVALANRLPQLLQRAREQLEQRTIPK